MQPRKQTNLLKGLLIVSLVVIAVLSYFLIEQNKSLEIFLEEKNRSIWYIVTDDKNAANKIDRSLAEALLATTNQDRHNALLEAQNATLKASTYAQHGNPDLNLYFYERFWRETQGYLTYLVEQNNEAFSPIQQGQLEEIRHYANLVSSELHDLEGTLSFNSNMENAAIMNDKLQKISESIKEMQEIGKEEAPYQNYKWANSGYLEADKQSEIFREEERLSREKLGEIAWTFMKEYWNHPEHKNVLSTGGGHDPFLGERVSFSAGKDTLLTSAYEVEVSIHGGHIISANYNGHLNAENDEAHGELSKEEVVALGDLLIKRWGEDSMFLDGAYQTGNNTHLRYVPTNQNIPNKTQPVTFQFDHVAGRLIRFDATLYFQNRNIEVTNRIQLTEEQAAATLPPFLKVAGNITLEIIKGKSRGNQIAYAIPVKGLDRVTKVYINSENGKNEGFEYR